VSSVIIGAGVEGAVEVEKEPVEKAIEAEVEGGIEVEEEGFRPKMRT
jgi:hypothetical protein